MPRATSAERARRLIALLSHLRKEGEAGLAPLADELGVSAAELADDLVTLSMCGVAPYDPLALVPVLVTGESFEVFGEIPAISAPVRLSLSEAKALVAALQAAGYDASDPLVSKLLAAVAGVDSAQGIARIVRAAVEGHDTDVYQALAAAIDRHEAVRISHAGAEQTVPSVRDVEPTALFAERGSWYLRAWCRSARDWRTFRLDRIVEVTPTGDVFGPRRDELVSNPEALELGALPVALVRFSAGAGFSEREWPGSSVVETRENGDLIVAIPYAGTSWLPRHVAGKLGLVEILEPAELREATARLAASILAEQSA